MYLGQQLWSVKTMLKSVPYAASLPTSLWTNVMTPMPVASRPFLNHERKPVKQLMPEITAVTQQPEHKSAQSQSWAGVECNMFTNYTQRGLYGQSNVQHTADICCCSTTAKATHWLLNMTIPLQILSYTLFKLCSQMQQYNTKSVKLWEYCSVCFGSKCDCELVSPDLVQRTVRTV